jgi:hypothetical protein
MAESNQSLTREFLAERDMRIFKMRQAGVPVNEISRRFNMTSQSVNTAVRRQLQRLNSEALLAYPEVLRMELERLDALQQAVWPLAQHRRIKTDDGTEVTVEPDLKAVQTLLSIMDRRSKLLGMEQTSVNVQLDINSPDQPIRATLEGAIKPKAVNAFNPEEEVKKLLEIMGNSGVLPSETIDQLLGNTGKQIASVDKEIIEAEIVEQI